MKKLVISVICLLTVLTISAQKKIKVNESSQSFADGNHNALIVNIYEADEDLITKEWKRLMKDYNAKVSTKKEIFADDAAIKDVSPNTMDVYARLEKNSEGDFDLIVAVDLGGAFMSSSQHSDKFKQFEKILYDFAVSTAKEAVKAQIEKEEKLLKQVEREQEQLVKQKEGLLKDIEDYKKKIQDAEANIQTNDKNQEQKRKEIETQQGVITTVKDKLEKIK